MEYVKYLGLGGFLYVELFKQTLIKFKIERK